MPQVHLVPKGKQNALLYVDGELTAPVSNRDMVFWDISDGCEITDEKLLKLLNDCVLPAGRKKAMDLLLAQERTEAELRSRLLQSCYGGAVVDSVMEYVKQFPYLDDERYALHYMRSVGRRKSMLEIRQRLTEKAVSETDYENALSRYKAERCEEAYETVPVRNAFGLQKKAVMPVTDEIDDEALEIETVRKLMHKKAPEGACLSKGEKEKLYASFLRKGFGYHSVRLVLKEYPTAESEDSVE